jgi:hypothetical protein
MDDEKRKGLQNGAGLALVLPELDEMQKPHHQETRSAAIAF